MATRTRQWRLAPSAFVAIASWLSGALFFALLALSAWALGRQEFGVAASLFAVVTVSFVAALGLQATVARSERTNPVPRSTSIRLTGWVAIVAGVGTALMAPFLDVPVLSSALVVTLAIAPLVLLADPLGRVQGREEFNRLARWLMLGAALRVLGGVPGLVLGSGLGVVLGTGAGTALAAALLWSWSAPGPAPGTSVPALRGALAATASLGGVLVLANLDVVLGRGLLSADDAGLYAAGALIAKIAFWAPSFLVLLGLPAFADPSRRRTTFFTVLTATGALAGMIALAVAIAPNLVLPFIGGQSYEPIADLLPVFALLGGLVAMIQVVAYSRIGRGGRRTGPLLLGAAALIGVVSIALAPGTPSALIATYIAAIVPTALLAVLLELRALQFPARASGAGQGPAE